MARLTPTAPLVSAVLCTRDRAGALRLTLESLCAQTLAREVFEVVVVDDGSADSTREVARSFEGRLPLRYASQRPAGIASARNHGVFFARGVVLVFVDDGIAGPRLLEEHLETHRRFPDPHVAVLGAERLDATLAADPLASFALAAGASPLAAWRGEGGGRLDFRDFRAGRASVKRALLVERGIFDAAFKDGGEDVELACRLGSAGLELVPNPRAEVFAAQAEGLDALCARLLREGAARAEIARRHGGDPAVREWAGLSAAGEAWRELAPAYEAILRSARELDRAARARLAEGLPVGGEEHALLHRSYLAAFRASVARGVSGAERPGDAAERRAAGAARG